MKPHSQKTRRGKRPPYQQLRWVWALILGAASCQSSARSGALEVVPPAQSVPGQVRAAAGSEIQRRGKAVDRSFVVVPAERVERRDLHGEREDQVGERAQ